MQQLQKKLQHSAVTGVAAIGAVLAVGILGTQSALAQSNVDANYNPLTQQSATYSVFDGISTFETIDITITGFSFVQRALGTFDLIEEAPFGSSVSDRIMISNTGVNDWGLINIISDSTLSPTGTTCNAAVDEGANPVCTFTLPLVNSNITLLATFTSIAGEPDNLLSDTLTIVRTPEPTSLTIIGSALAAMGLLGWRRRKEV